MKNIFLKILLTITFLDLAYLNYKIFQPATVIENKISPASETCGEQCRTIVAAAISSIPTITPAPTLPAKALAAAGPSSKKSFITTYLPIPGQGETMENRWTSIPGTSFWLNTADYPRLQEAYFESNLKLFNANGQAFLRLFDATAGIEVWGSEISTGSQSFVFLTSGKITLRPGNHQYVIQARSLTADTTIFNSPRIKLILQN